jgi:hypothetical protein
MRDPTEEKWLREGMDSLKSMLVDHPELTEVHFTELAVNNRRLKGPFLLRMLEDLSRTTGVKVHLWIEPREPMSVILKEEEVDNIEVNPEQITGIGVELGKKQEVWNKSEDRVVIREWKNNPQKEARRLLLQYWQGKQWEKIVTVRGNIYKTLLLTCLITVMVIIYILMNL